MLELRRATLADSDAVYALICELKQAEFNRQAFNVGFAANLDDRNLCYQLALLNGAVVGMISLHMQFHLHHVNWVGEIQELVVMPAARGHGVGSKLLAWAEEQARIAGADCRRGTHRAFHQRQTPRRSPFLPARRLSKYPFPLY